MHPVHDQGTKNTSPDTTKFPLGQSTYNRTQMDWGNILSHTGLSASMCFLYVYVRIIYNIALCRYILNYTSRNGCYFYFALDLGLFDCVPLV